MLDFRTDASLTEGITVTLSSLLADSIPLRNLAESWYLGTKI